MRWQCVFLRTTGRAPRPFRIECGIFGVKGAEILTWISGIPGRSLTDAAMRRASGE